MDLQHETYCLDHSGDECICGVSDIENLQEKYDSLLSQHSSLKAVASEMAKYIDRLNYFYFVSESRAHPALGRPSICSCILCEAVKVLSKYNELTSRETSDGKGEG